MSETVELNEDEDMDEMVDVARDVSERLSSLGEEKRERLESELEGSSGSVAGDGAELVDGVVSDVSVVSSSFGRDSVNVEVTYVFDGEECVEEFSFDLPSDESDLSVENDLVRFVHYVGDGGPFEFEKTLHRDVPLFVSGGGDSVELGIPDSGF